MTRAGDRKGSGPFQMCNQINLLSMEKKLLLSTLAGFLVIFFGGWVLFGMLLKSSMEKFMAAMGSCAMSEPSFVPMIVAQLAISLLLAWLIVRMNRTSFAGGAILAAWVTFLIIVWYDGWMFATFPFMTMEMSLVDVLGNTALGALAGGVMGWVASKV